MSNDHFKTARESVALVSEIIKTAGDNPNVKEAGNNLGQTAVTLTKLVNNALLPLAAVNFACEKSRIYFQGKFQQDLSEKIAKIPEEDIVEPKASIAGPALQGLAFTHEEQNLKDMYLNLLATAMDGRVSTTAHPAFVEIIKQLDGMDAALVRHALKFIEDIPIVQLLLTTAGEQGYRIILSHLVNLAKPPVGELVENPMLPAMIDNWARLGLVEIDYKQHLTRPAAYDWVETRPEFIKLREQYEHDNIKLTYQKGIIRCTYFGQRFAAAIGLLPYTYVKADAWHIVPDCEANVQRRGNKE
ncbi:MAG: DUF4393 domain-containing protein [Candidatus Electrothrix sp. AS4_5]|nr:DUF4393 domain-containing protein [Candidatus Electrothrix gigas]